ncbi:MAG TPA: site-2 protease family protein [Clostridiaceae bacterium]|nr:site-2 protease family protein [Clostridiaceae bacterium]
MFTFLISAIKIIFLLGFLILIHETGHFVVAKLCKVRVNEFAIGFGPTIWKKQGKETKYALRLIPLGGFISMEGEEELSDKEGSFSKASIPKRVAIVAAGAIVNIIFALIVYFILATSYNFQVTNNWSSALTFAGEKTGTFITSTFEGLKQLFTGKAGLDQMMGPVGISEVVAKTNGMFEFINMIAIVSLSLGVTNLLPIPALDGGKILLLIIEAIRKKPLSQKIEINIQLLGFSFIIILALFVTWNDIARII